jgi:peptidoglycan/LPS O-acetylase OafA/YrhL
MLEWIGGITVTFFMVISGYFLAGSLSNVLNYRYVALPKHFVRDTIFLIVLFVLSAVTWVFTIGQNVKVLWRG